VVALFLQHWIDTERMIHYARDTLMSVVLVLEVVLSSKKIMTMSSKRFVILCNSFYRAYSCSK
jgi:hypothetical protein